MNFIMENLDTIILAVVTLVLGWDRLRSGSSTIRKEIAEDYKERNKQLEDRLKEIEESSRNTNLQVAKLEGIVHEKDKHIESLTQILQGRNPEMVAILKEISDSNIEIKKFMETMYSVLKNEMSLQTTLLVEDQQRAKRIDATLSKKLPVIKKKK